MLVKNSFKILIINIVINNFWDSHGLFILTELKCNFLENTFAIMYSRYFNSNYKLEFKGQHLSKQTPFDLEHFCTLYVKTTSDEVSYRNLYIYIYTLPDT